jgi:hypothetical protein
MQTRAAYQRKMLGERLEHEDAPEMGGGHMH